MQGWHYCKGLIYYSFSFLTSEYVDPVLDERPGNHTISYLLPAISSIPPSLDPQGP